MTNRTRKSAETASLLLGASRNANLGECGGHVGAPAAEELEEVNGSPRIR